MFPTRVVFEKDRFGGGVCIGVYPGFTGNPEPGNGFGLDASVFVGAGWATVSWRSCAHGASARFVDGGAWLYHVRLSGQEGCRIYNYLMGENGPLIPPRARPLPLIVGLNPF